MDTIINSIVSNYLADYLEINPEKTKTSILSGTVELSGVKFNKNLFTTLNIPYLELEDGYIGKINVKLSLPRFYLYPIIVNVDQIYIKVRPKNVNKISEKEILNTFEIYKQKKLKEFEELMNIKFSNLFEDFLKSNDNKKGGPSMVENIINNLHIDIEKIVLIFDDCISNPSYPCTFGVTLNKLYIDSTSKDFTEIKEEDKSSPFKYKKLSIISLNSFLDKINKEDIIKDEKTGDITANHKIKEDKLNKLNEKEKEYLKDSLNFYLYCESEIDDYSKDEKYHNYLLRELNFDIKLMINEKFAENNQPQIDATLEIPTILTQITNIQMEAIKNNLNYISLKDLYQQTTIDNYYKSKEKLDDDTIKKYLEDYSLYYKTKYIDIYKNDKENKKYLKNMQEIEKNLSLDNIKALREMGNDIINNIIEIGKIDKEITDKESSWTNFFTSRNSKEIAKLKIEREQKIEEQKKIQEKNSTMNQFKNYITGILNNNDDKPIKEDKPQFIFKFIMKEFILIIKEEKNNVSKKVFEMKYDLLQCEAIIKTISQYIRLSLRNMEFAQYISNNKEYKKILYTKLKIDNDNKNSKYNDNEVSLILIEFEHNFLLPISPFKFKLHFDKQIYIIIDYYYLYYLYDLLLQHIGAIDLDNLTSMMNEKISNIVSIGYNNLLKNKEKEKQEEEKKNKKSFNMHVDILLNAPIFLLPLNFKDEHNTELMSISLGQLKIYSKLADGKDKNEIYDKYLVEFSNISVKTLKTFNSQENIKDEEGVKLLYPSSFHIAIEKYIYAKPLDEHKKDDFSPILVNMNVNSTKFSLSEEQIIFMIKYLENFKRTQFEFEKKNEKKEKIKMKEEENRIVEAKEKEKKEKEIKKQKENINAKKEEEKLKENKIKDINNVIKISITFGDFQMFLTKNLIIDEQNQDFKKINFLSFFFRESTIYYLLKSNGSMDMEVSFGHFNLYDDDYKLEGNKKTPYINPELRYIIGTTPFGIKDKDKEKNNNGIKFSDMYEHNFDKNLKESIKINLNLNAESNKTTVKMSMSKLTIIPNFSTLSRLYMFLNKYLELYKESMNKIKNEKLAEKMKEEKLNSIKSNDSMESQLNKKKIDDNIKKKEETKEVSLKKGIIKTKVYSLIDVEFSMKGIDIYIPVDPIGHNTSIIFMTIEIPINYVMESDIELELDPINIIKTNYNKKDIQLNVYINKGNLSIYDYKDDVILLNSINQIYDKIDFYFSMINKLDKVQQCNKFYIDIKMGKDMDISFNINHIIVFMDLFNKINIFLNDMKELEAKKIKEDFKLEDENLYRRAKTSTLIESKVKKQEMERIIKKEKNKTNITKYNDIFTYEFDIKNISIKFYDIIDGSYQSLLEFSMNKTEIKMFQNSNPKDCQNLMEYLINTFTNEKKKLKTYKKKDNFYLYFNIFTNIEIKSLNNYINQWEYFVEPLSVNFYYCKFLKRMRPNIELEFENMLNINVSLNLAKILSFILQKISMNKKTIDKNKEGNILKNEIMPESSHYLGSESPILIIENNTGVDMEIWFDNIKYDNSNNDLIIKLKKNTKYKFTNSSLKKFNVKIENNNINSTISYKFCLDKDFIKNNNINEKNLIGNYLNVNYYQIDIHDINELVKISIESCSDNLLCRHISFNSLISIINETKFKDMQLCSNDNSQKIELEDNKKEYIPISWFLYNKNKNINLSYNNDTQILMKNISGINEINKCIKFNNKDVIIIDIIKYKIDLEEYYYNKNIVDKKDLYRVDIIISSPINITNNTPFDFYINNNKILSTKSSNIYSNNFNLLSDYIKIINEKGKKNKNNEKQIMSKIIKDINLQINYDNKLFTASTYIEEKDESNKDDTKEEGKAVNNFSSYNKNLSILLKDENSKYFLICRLSFNNPLQFITYNERIYESMNLELNSFKYEIIFDYYFINRTNLNIYVNNKVIEGLNSKNNICPIPPNNYFPISKALLNNKIMFRGKYNYWSDKIELSAIGEDFNLNIKNDEKNYNPLGIKIRFSNLFKKSIDIVIENKYVIINDLPFDINIKEEKISTVMNIKSNENKILLLNEESLKKKDNYRIGIGSSYSHLFDIDKLGTYDMIIDYNKKIFEEKKIDIEGKLVEMNNKKYYPIRCIISTNNKNVIYILFSYNKEYINQFRNYTPHNLELIINKDINSKISVKPEKIVPLIYFNNEGTYEPFEEIEIIFKDKSSQVVNLNKVTTIFYGKKRDYVIKIQPDNNNSVKCITVFNKDNEHLKNEYNILHRIKKYTKVTGYKIQLDLYGIGFSIINEQPKEIFYLSLYKIHLFYKFSKSINILNEMESYKSLLFSLSNFQLDYCLDNSYEIIFNPSNQILPPKPDEKQEEKKEKKFIDKVLEDEENNTPFIQFVMSQKNKSKGEKEQLVYSIYPQIAIIIQEFDIRINTILINSLIKVIAEYNEIFLPSKDDNQELKNNNDNDNNKDNSIKDENLIIDNNDEYIIKVKEQLLNKDGKISNLVINNLTLSAINSNITFKVNKNAIEIRYLPELTITIIKTFFSTISSFSDVNLKLSELLFSNVFSDFNSLKHKLISYYKYQVLGQIYKIIFNMDIFGNPVHLLEGVGSGIYQLFNEPRKGLLKGPEEFGIGLTRGARALVSNVVGGGFNTVSKITGTLLTATKNISSMGTEEEVVIKEEEKPKGFFSGALSGFKKGIGELTHGVTGIVTKPIEESKKGGVGGFFKGVGTGLVGAVMAPVNTFLTVGNEVSSGISNSEFISNKKSLRRFRLPRTLYKYLPISPYNEIKEIERKKQRDKIKGSKYIVISLGNEKLYLENSTEIIMCSKLSNLTNLVFTNVMIKILDKDCIKLIEKVYICDIKDKKENNNDIELILKNDSRINFKFKDVKNKDSFITNINKYLN